MITTDFLSGLDRFRLIVKKRVTSKYSGGRKSPFLGRGTSVKDYRAYVPGDDFRLIDWRIYARTDDLYVKRFEEEKDLTVHIVIDSSSSMDYGNPKKFDYASMLGVGFAYLAMKDNEKFRFSTFSDTLQMFKAERGMNHLALMVDHLNSVKTSGQSVFAETMNKYRLLLKTRALLVVISDFLFDFNEIEQGLLSVAGGDMKVIQVLDKTERKLEIEGDFKLKDSESSDIMQTYVSARLKTEYQHSIEEHASKIAQVCAGLKADYHLITTNTPIFDAFHMMTKEK